MMGGWITVFGGAGAQGSPVVESALAAGYRVRAVGRRPDPLHARFGDRVEVAPADLNDLGSVEAALQGVDGAFLHVPIGAAPEERRRQLETVLAAARRTRLPLLVFSTTGHSHRRFGTSPVVRINAEMAARVLASGVRSVVLAPTVYLENLRTEPLVPRLGAEGVLDYPPLTADRQFSWTSWWDQATLALAAFERPHLAGRIHEIATPGAVTGPELAGLLEPWVGRRVRFVATTPDQFGARLRSLTGSAFVGNALAQLYRDIGSLPRDGATVDTRSLEKDFGVELTPIGEHFASWGRESGGELIAVARAEG